MDSRFVPRYLMCCECREEFVFTVAAQEYFAERGYSEDPKRCKSCHTAYKKHQRDHQTVPHGGNAEEDFYSR